MISIHTYGNQGVPDGLCRLCDQCGAPAPPAMGGMDDGTLALTCPNCLRAREGIAA